MADQTPTRDALHHEAFSELRVARSFFEHYLPSPLAAACDWSTLANETTSYKKCFEADAFCDLLFTVRFQEQGGPGRGQPLLLNLLFEHQSRPDPLMPYRILRYMVRIWERWTVDHPGTRRLPPVYPVVLHQSRRKWRAPDRMLELFDLPGVDVAAPSWLPDFSFQLIDLAALPFDQLRADILANGLLAIMKAIEAPDPMPVLDPVLEILNTALGKDNDLQLLSRFLGYLFHYSRNLDMPQFLMKIDSLTQPAMKAKGLSLAEQFIAHGHEQGLQEGLQEGRQEGQQEGRRMALVSTLERLIARRFGPLPDPLRARLQAAPIPELERLTDAILDARSLDELFRPQG